MKNKAKLAFHLLEQEMEMIYKEDLIQFVGGSGYISSGGYSSGGYSWQQMYNALNSGDVSQIPQGSYFMDSNGKLTYMGGELNEVVVTASGGITAPYGYWPLVAPAGGDEANDANELVYFGQTVWNLGVIVINGVAWIGNQLAE